mmetsp:Transcript_31519/g.80769  ORF Transcript_31519/g.80769 Transcript_31519/m.80769 type:complete len:225 (-) Transcript_31519:91-765(-)
MPPGDSRQEPFTLIYSDTASMSSQDHFHAVMLLSHPGCLLMSFIPAPLWGVRQRPRDATPGRFPHAPTRSPVNIVRSSSQSCGADLIKGVAKRLHVGGGRVVLGVLRELWLDGAVQLVRGDFQDGEHAVARLHLLHRPLVAVQLPEAQRCRGHAAHDAAGLAGAGRGRRVRQAAGLLGQLGAVVCAEGTLLAEGAFLTERPRFAEGAIFVEGAWAGQACAGIDN